MRNAVLLMAMLGLAQYAAAAGFAHKLQKHKAPPAVAVPPVEISGARQQCITVPELAAADGNFTALLAAAKAAGLDTVLANPELKGTLFAPTDAAFAALLEELGVSAAELLTNTDLVGKVLSYHFVPEAMLTTSMMFDSQKLPTLLTANTTSIHHYTKEATMLVVDKLKVTGLKHPKTTGYDISIIPSGGAPAKIIQEDLLACNVVVQVVDTVLVPELSPEKPKYPVPGVLSGIPATGSYGGKKSFLG